MQCASVWRMKTNYDVIIVGAGAAGLMCAIEAGKRGRSVCALDHSDKIGEKIRISGGGRCNFTNLNMSAEHYISNNLHFCKSALAQFTPNDFIALLNKHKIPFHEKGPGQLFCDDSATQIINMLLNECQNCGATIKEKTQIKSIKYAQNKYFLETSHGTMSCQSLVIATGGLSIPKIGATDFGFRIAKQFGINIIHPEAALVPFILNKTNGSFFSQLTGVSLNATVACGDKLFSDSLLFTHKGLSGPAILQISSYWNKGDEISINLAPDIQVLDFLKKEKEENPKQNIETIISKILPKRLSPPLCKKENASGRIADLSSEILKNISCAINDWRIKPAGTEGYKKAEVTRGGIDTNELSSKTMESKKQPGLFFIGEVIDVTGHLGGYNFQWAWSSGFVAGQYA